MQSARIFASISFLLFPALLFAQSDSDVLAYQVSQSDQWKKQLYLSDRPKGGPYRPRIQSDDFYFSGTESIDPFQELLQTRQAVFSNLDQLNNDHPACRFPGRFLFLNAALALDYDTSLLAECSNFQNWARFDRYDSLSVVMVEGYYGNPASSFGHLVLRHGRSDGAQQLLDTSINFGARVPQGEGPIKYILNGLAGGYLASFTAESYYRQDLVYTQVEHRDMWHYELDLDDTQRVFFLAHLWELLDSPSTYYFLKNNCAFAVAEILEIVFERNLVNQNTLFYPPVTLFHELEEIHQQGDLSVIRSKHFVPSQQSVLKSLYATLSAQQRQVFGRYIGREQQPVQPLLADLEEAEAAEIIESLISFYSYLISGYPELGTELYERRRQLIVARLEYPSGRFLQAAEIEPTTEPGKTARVSRLSMGVSLVDNQPGLVLGWVPYSQSATDLGNDDSSELTVLALDGRLQEDALDAKFTLIRVAQRSDLRDRLPGDWPLSWTIDLGWQTAQTGRYRAGGQADIEVGQSVRVGSMLLSALGAFRQSGWESGLGARAELALTTGQRFTWIGYVDYTFWTSGESVQLGLDSRYSFSPRWSLEAELSSFDRGGAEAELDARLALAWHFR